MLLTATFVLAAQVSPVEGQPPPAPLRIVDAETGAAIENAEVLGVYESKAPLWGAPWFKARWITDADGLARITFEDPRAPDTGWYAVRAPGYGISSLAKTSGEEAPIRIELHRAIPTRFRLVDFLGRPLPLVHLGYCIGCGHSPDVASAVTDRDGWASFDFVGPKESRDIADVYPVGEGIATDYLGASWREAQDAGQLVVAQPGATLRGKILRHDGSPASGWYVGYHNRHRGPWTRCDAGGGFVFPGLPSGECPHLMVLDADGEQWSGVGRARYGIERIVRVGKERWTGEPDYAHDRTGAMTLTVDVEGLTEGVAAAWEDARIPVEIWDPVTGWSVTTEVKPGEPHTTKLVEGTYEVEIGGKGSPIARRALGQFDVHEGAHEPVAATVAAPRIAIVSVSYDGEVSALGVATGSAPAVYVDLMIEISREVSRRSGVFEAFAVPAESFGLWLVWKDDDRQRSLLRVWSSKTREDGVELWNVEVDPNGPTVR